jgi:hypothetical protein
LLLPLTKLPSIFNSVIKWQARSLLTVALCGCSNSPRARFLDTNSSL